MLFQTAVRTKTDHLLVYFISAIKFEEEGRNYKHIFEMIISHMVFNLGQVTQKKNTTFTQTLTLIPLVRP